MSTTSHTHNWESENPKKVENIEVTLVTMESGEQFIFYKEDQWIKDDKE